MRKLLVAAALVGVAAATTGVASASILQPTCPPGYVGVVVDNHDVCTNILQYIKGGNS